MTMPTHQTFPYRRLTEDDCVGGWLRKGQVAMLLGCIERIDIGWAGRMRVTLKLSMGTLVVSGSRDTIPLNARNGDWLRVHVRRRFGEPEVNESEVVVLSATLTQPDIPAAWVPTARCHRLGRLRKLRQLLVRLHPAAQRIFMGAMAESRVQHGFFWRVAATDHHGYPGGLFDQSLDAALQVEAGTFASDTDREVATLATLLYDLGKTRDATLRPDFRRRPLAHPHGLTGSLVTHALDQAEPLHPEMVAHLRAILTATPLTPLPADTQRIASHVRAALRQAWKQEAPHARQ